ncbi:RHS repeat-associated core domain-containing protein [Herpetosiphon llansteffanensis]|uniref:RHS repeat-associated core domain-containing protein n=1 Tax=Herpetosiphon llansteffanensis TaxID=2094568 RepID=UPI0013DFD8BB|nr:RHS repeat-associated core domain-containing protein [Herpetosiphon llansteffanensis]
MLLLACSLAQMLVPSTSAQQPTVAPQRQAIPLSSTVDYVLPTQQAVELATTNAVAAPGLTFELNLAHQVSVGQAVPFTLTLINRSTTEGHNIVVSLPVPAGVQALSKTNLVDQTQWQWQIKRLKPQSQQTFSGSIRITSRPTHGALLFNPHANASNLPQAATLSAGALIAPQTTAKQVEHWQTQDQMLQSSDQRVSIALPTGAHAAHFSYVPYQTMALNKTSKALQYSEFVPERRGFSSFEIQASQKSFAPVELQFAYSPEELQVLGIQEQSLRLFHYDQASQSWQSLATTIDSVNHVAKATITNDGAFNLSDGSSPSTAYLPTLQGFQGGGFTGAASYSVPIEVPAGAAGHKPVVNLSYSSAASDGSNGTRPLWQASSVGKGWDLGIGGSIGRTTSAGSSDHQWDSFSLVFDGQSSDMVRGQPLDGNYTNLAEANWTWHATDETFVKLRKSASSDTWTAWTKNGTRYEFNQALRWGTNSPANRFETYKWLLTKVVDPSGNAVVYEYHVDTIQAAEPIHPTWFLQNVFWGYDGATPGTGTPRYALAFDMSPRWSAPTENVDLNWEYTSSRVMGKAGTPHEAYRIDKIKVLSMPPDQSNYQLMRAYKLNYAAFANSVSADVSNGQRVLTLANVQRLGKNNEPLPAISFSYGLSQGNALEPTPGWNRLTQVDNGQGGLLTINYEHVWNQGIADYAKYYQNYYRVANVVQADSSNLAYSRDYLSKYSYAYPALNDDNHSAAVIYARYPESGNGDSRFALAHAEKSEFRGHAQVSERIYDGSTATAPLLRTTETWFHQGNGGSAATPCQPAIITPAPGNQYVNVNDSCYLTMRDSESWKGKVSAQETWFNGSRLSRITNNYARITLPFYGNDGNATHATQSNHYKRAGLWRAFNYSAATSESTYEAGTTNARSITTSSTYEATYGNLTAKSVADDTGTVLRKELAWYTTRDDANSYIVDRPWQTATTDGQGRYLMLSANFYDGATTTNVLGTRGLITRQSHYFNVPLQTDLTGTTLYGSDVVYGHDVYGNRTTQASYNLDYSTRINTNGSVNYGVPGKGTAARTSTTEYDSTYHAYPVRETNPLNQSQQAEYDYQMGSVTKVIDLNGNATSATYDGFGRMTNLIKPGDSSSFPTAHIDYYDTYRPILYLVSLREDAGQSAIRPILHFYNGFGQEIQTKAESIDGSQHIVNDTNFDGLGRATSQSEPRYVTDSSNFWGYVPASNPLYQATTTSFDGLNRPLIITSPGNRTVEHHYGVTSSFLYDDVIDQNRHRTQYRYDVFGRLREVNEINGNCATGYWASYACAGAYTTNWSVASNTRYSYDALDRLTTVIDAQNNTSTMRYDSLGRKMRIQDPDMGQYNYSYDAASNLNGQTNAKGQTISFKYDALNRLTSQVLPDGSHNDYFYDFVGQQTAGYNYGKGHRTSMQTVLANGTIPTFQRWEYDARGREIFTGHSTDLTNAHHILTSYDSADRVKTRRYQPIDETVTYNYDAAWRDYSLCTSLGGCYVTGATYDALNQPTRVNYGNGSYNQYRYDDPTRLLETLEIFSAQGTNLYSRNYWYDKAGNLNGIGTWDNATNNQTRQIQYFNYDDQNRLTRAWTTGDSAGAYDQSMSYDSIGNLLSKAGVTYTYPAAGSARPHAATTIGSKNYTYDTNGNLSTTYTGTATNGNGNRYSWDYANRLVQVESYLRAPRSSGSGCDNGEQRVPAALAPEAITPITCPNRIASPNQPSVDTYSVQEQYVYDADGKRAARIANGQTIVYFEGAWEDTLGVNARKLYTFNGSIVAHRDSDNTMSYLHGDQLGSVSIVTNASGLLKHKQEFDPWGNIREGGASSTKINYTGQYRDDTGLIFMNARYYDPKIGRFISADTVVSGSPSGSMNGSGLRSLTTDFTDPAFTMSLNQEQRSTPWFTLSQSQQQDIGTPWGPANPQSLNRYSYVQNNPLTYTDPTGHVKTVIRNATQARRALTQLKALLESKNIGVTIKGAEISGGYKDIAAVTLLVDFDSVVAVLGPETAVVTKTLMDALQHMALAPKESIPPGIYLIYKEIKKNGYVNSSLTWGECNDSQCNEGGPPIQAMINYREEINLFDIFYESMHMPMESTTSHYIKQGQGRSMRSIFYGVDRATGVYDANE